MPETKIKNVVSLGDGLGIVIDRSTLDELRIDVTTRLSITSDGKGIYIQPIPSTQSERFVDAGRRMMDIHADAFRKLAQ